jgi:hypothetical protein
VVSLGLLSMPAPQRVSAVPISERASAWIAVTSREIALELRRSHSVPIVEQSAIAGRQIHELASLVAHRRGAQVTASDCHPLAHAFLDENTRLNGLLPLPYCHGLWGTAAAREDGLPVLTHAHDAQPVHTTSDF